MKNLTLIALMLVLCISCTKNKINLKEGQMFTHKYGYNTVTFIAKSFNKSGVFATSPNWLFSENEFISYSELEYDEQYSELGLDSRFLPINKIKASKLDNPLMRMVVGDKFRMMVQGEMENFIVKEVGKESLLVTADDWLCSSSMDIPFKNYNPKWYKFLGKHKAHR